MKRADELSRPGVTRFVTRLLRAIAGAPDYERYVAHMTRCHPELAVVPRREFYDEQMRLRYERPGSRCC